ncbi:putative DNA alkylation repair enzyme [Sphaerochaeta pleomorpha str. Grapes]|uniref:Putative DNA alkylation repair enzyme n=1 Tax=Sphaerochaeta pleomorpha (strain ATCC BAA-1885 / DSM 22778 / Grapes) TaxID=158190 RepID=G8QUS8_SPHPG|nr:DNA alkylation repair protein [Sphaerochaeta pleomorpha]AEV30386.1 putative DNA alkylation repair enzyme [Sphaerochaeta pleomorpha str. Grapes]
MNREMLQAKLFLLSDSAYAQFQYRLKCSDHPVLGIRSPQLNALAKELAKAEGSLFIDDFLLFGDVSYEEIILAYKVLGLLKLDSGTTQGYLRELLAYNDGWATNDTLCSALTTVGKHQKEYWPFFLGFLSSENPWDIRFATIALMCWYLTDEYANKTLEILSAVTNDHYYVTMGLGWFYATAFAKYREETLPYLKTGRLPIGVQKKAIQKCIESFRVSPEDKVLLRSIRQEVSKR